jgi:hypothetical protein
MCHSKSRTVLLALCEREMRSVSSQRPMAGSIEMIRVLTHTWINQVSAPSLAPLYMHGIRLLNRAGESCHKSCLPVPTPSIYKTSVRLQVSEGIFPLLHQLSKMLLGGCFCGNVKINYSGETTTAVSNYLQPSASPFSTADVSIV